MLKKQIKSIQVEKTKQLVSISSSRAFYLSLNAKPNSILKLRAVRKAISLAINQQGMLTNIVQGLGQINTCFSPLLTQKCINLGNAYNVPQARELLSQIKIPTQLTLLTFKSNKTDHKEVLQALKNMLIRVGIHLLVTETDSKEVWAKSMDEYDLTFSTWQTSLMNSVNIYKSLFVDSPIAPYLKPLYAQQKNINRSDFFIKLLNKQYIIVLLSVDELWGADRKYAFNNIFSINSIPYWQELRLKNKL
ncbi:hypothetical protein JI57_02600 [Psychromonas sp. PRT-SC03]|nr:hypothetical protein JI57_02600 [Psychromonas sp. PRT-SC03]